MPPPHTARRYRYFVSTSPANPNRYNVMEQSVLFPDSEHTRVAASYESEQEANETSDQLNAGTYHKNWRTAAKQARVTQGSPNRAKWWFRE